MTKARTLLSVKKNYFLRAFLWGMGLSFLFFLPFIIMNDGYFFFYGDFNVQQIPFYQMIHDSVQNGNIGWSYTTDLGANIIGSYSFYNIGSPFFWLTLLFPSVAVPYMIAPLLMLKFGCASLGAYTFLRRYVKNQDYAVIGGLLYAFSGFGIYNIFFNHFHEAMITFPFLLAAVDEFIYEKRKGAVALAVFAASLVNYYFFAGQAVFVFIYWCIRMVTGSFRMNIKEFIRFAFEVIIGFLCSAVILIPSILSVLQNSRVNNFPNGWGALLYSNEQRYLHIFLSFFFPPDMPAYANFTPDSNAKWSSVAGWLPLFSMVGVLSFYKLKTHKWLRVFIPTLFLMAFVPILNSMFQLFNATYYARWFYMLTLMLALATVICLDHEETDFKPALRATFIITFAITALIGLMPSTSTDTNGNSTTTYGLEKYPDRFWIWAGIAFAGLVALTVILCFRKNQKIFIRTVSICLSVLIVGYSMVLVGTGVVNANYKKDFIKNYAIGNKDKFEELTDLREVRSDFYEAMDNMGMFWQIPTIQAFQSIVPGSVMDFYKSIGVERSVGSRPKTDVYGIRSFLSCKYLFDYTKDSNQFENSLGSTEMPGWELKETKNAYKVYENKCYIPYGFTYDEYITENQFNSCSESNRHLLLLKAMVLTDEQAKKYGDILKHRTSTTEYNYTEDEYFKDCENRKKLTCSSIEFNNSSFTAKITTGNSDELVFFSIPYESGWSATVNGQPTDVEKVNKGFMAVRVPANKTSTIVFNYKTPGLSVGAVVSGVSVVIFIAYMVFWRVPKRKKENGLYVIDDLAPDDDEYNETITEVSYENEMSDTGENTDTEASEPSVISDDSKNTVTEETEKSEKSSDISQENNQNSGNERTKL
ncbi:MAG: YfhO family protein [Acutalibacteraceae bacterium]